MNARTSERPRRIQPSEEMMEQRSSYTSTVYELHPGDPRHAVCDINDIIKLLEAVDGTA